MRERTILYAITIVLFIGYSQQFANSYYSGFLFAQDVVTISKKNIKKEKKKRMKDAANAEKASLKRHQDIQTEATRKRMKKHLKEANKNAKNSHR